MTTLETWELWSYIITVVGLPFAIVVFLFDQRKERQNEDDEIYQKLSDEYADFLRLVLDHADLQLRSSREPLPNPTPDQQERILIIFDLLVSLFERAYLLVYEDDMNKRQQRQWQSWEDYMRNWCARDDFRSQLPHLLEGEDPDFARHIFRIAREEAERVGHPMPDA